MFALQPHLQATGVHASLTRTRSGQDTVLLDTDYSVAAQPIGPVASALQELEAGDRLTAVCSYVNTTGHVMNYGESSSNEQCFVGMYRTPPHVPADPTVPSIFACAEGVAN